MTSANGQQKHSTLPIKEPIGLILAGGQSSRMGEVNKLLRPLKGTTLLAKSVKRLLASIDTIIISTNSPAIDVESALGNLNDAHKIHLINDEITGFAGPLAGVHAGMRWSLTHRPEATHLLSIAADTPFFPKNLKSAFLQELYNEGPDTIIMARSGSFIHPVFALWPLSLFQSLEDALEGGVRKIRQFTDQHNLKIKTFPLDTINDQKIDPFFNINTPDDWLKLEEIELLFDQ